MINIYWQYKTCCIYSASFLQRNEEQLKKNMQELEALCVTPPLSHTHLSLSFSSFAGFLLSICLEILWNESKDCFKFAKSEDWETKLKLGFMVLTTIAAEIKLRNLVLDLDIHEITTFLF
jgi:hypothetical protein